MGYPYPNFCVWAVLGPYNLMTWRQASSRVAATLDGREAGLLLRSEGGGGRI